MFWVRKLPRWLMEWKPPGAIPPHLTVHASRAASTSIASRQATSPKQRRWNFSNRRSCALLIMKPDISPRDIGFFISKNVLYCEYYDCHDQSRDNYHLRHFCERFSSLNKAMVSPRISCEGGLFSILKCRRDLLTWRLWYNKCIIRRVRVKIILLIT